MGKSYNRYEDVEEPDGFSSYRRRASIAKKTPKVSMHGSHVNKKTCRCLGCNDPWSLGKCGRDKKYVNSQKHLEDGHDFIPSSATPKGDGGRTWRGGWSECNICYDTVKDYGFNQVSCGGRIKTICNDCKVNHYEHSGDSCPMCRSHPVMPVPKEMVKKYLRR
jgi:hypothetical protein